MNNTTYLDELVLYEYGKYDMTKYKEWVSEWDKWLHEERSYVIESNEFKEAKEEKETKKVKNTQVQKANSI
tara:strand:- start:100 stop:312 length:213 start_codon:yes stop_codon:yes gene_type:complete